jgi:hypothetical protein
MKMITRLERALQEFTRPLKNIQQCSKTVEMPLQKQATSLVHISTLDYIDGLGIVPFRYKGKFVDDQLFMGSGR